MASHTAFAAHRDTESANLYLVEFTTDGCYCQEYLLAFENKAEQQIGNLLRRLFVNVFVGKIHLMRRAVALCESLVVAPEYREVAEVRV